MNGLEMMLSRMIGMTPQEMRHKVETAVKLMEDGAAKAAKIERDLEAIKSHLGITEITENVAAIANGRSSANNHSVQL